MSETDSISDYLIEGVERGSVRQSKFLSAQDSALVVRSLREQGLNVRADGGYPGARRRLVIAAPASVPSPSPKVELWEVDATVEPDVLTGTLQRLRIAEDEIGDCIQLHDSLVVALTSDAAAALPETLSVASVEVHPRRFESAERLGATQHMQRVLAAMRADAIGAAAFGVSRTYFSKGAIAGNVYVDGQRANKSTQLEIGSELYAEGLGRVTLRELLGTTKRGNQRAVLEVERRKQA